MALARLTKQCRECPFVETCEHKEMEALGYLPEPIMADVKAPVTADLYATLIINKRRTFDQVPEKFKADVEAKLLEYGYDTNGDLIAEEE